MDQVMSVSPVAEIISGFDIADKIFTGISRCAEVVFREVTTLPTDLRDFLFVIGHPSGRVGIPVRLNAICEPADQAVQITEQDGGEGEADLVGDESSDASDCEPTMQPINKYLEVERGSFADETKVPTTREILEKRLDAWVEAEMERAAERAESDHDYKVENCKASEAKERILACFDSKYPCLSLSCLGLITLPESIGNLTALTYLKLSYNKLTTLPESIGNLTALEWLELYCNQLTTLPESIGSLTALEKLLLNRNQLTRLQESIGKLTALEWFDLDDNQLTTLPESIGNLTALKWFFLNGNQLTRLPESIGNLTALKILLLQGNPHLDTNTVPSKFRNS